MFLETILKCTQSCRCLEKGSEEVKDEEKEKREDCLEPVFIYMLKDKKDNQLVTMHQS